MYRGKDRKNIASGFVTETDTGEKPMIVLGISNYTPQFTVGCNYLSLPEIPKSSYGNTHTLLHFQTCILLVHIVTDSLLGSIS